MRKKGYIGIVNPAMKIFNQLNNIVNQMQTCKNMYFRFTECTLVEKVSQGPEINPERVNSWSE